MGAKVPLIFVCFLAAPPPRQAGRGGDTQNQVSPAWRRKEGAPGVTGHLGEERDGKGVSEVGEEGPRAVRAGSLPQEGDEGRAVTSDDVCRHWLMSVGLSIEVQCGEIRLLLSSLLWEGGFPELATPGFSPEPQPLALFPPKFSLNLFTGRAGCNSHLDSWEQKPSQHRLPAAAAGIHPNTSCSISEPRVGWKESQITPGTWREQNCLP